MNHCFSVEEAISHGVEKAIILQHFRFWLEKNMANKRHVHDDYVWTYNSARAFHKLFPYWSEKKIYRLLKDLETRGLILSGNYNKKRNDRTKWYTIPEFSISHKREMHFSDSGNPFPINGRPLPYINPDIEPDSIYLERFEQFYLDYPKKRSKGVAEKTFLKIKPSEQLTEQMLSAIERAKTSRDWLKDDGQFIPYPATWLNAGGWNDEYSEETNEKHKSTNAKPQSANTGFWESVSDAIPDELRSN